jgi:hypothetical protein
MQGTCMENRDIVPCILNLCTRWMRVVSYTPQSLYSHGRNSTTHWIIDCVGPWPDPDSGEEKNPALPGIGLWSPDHSRITIDWATKSAIVKLQLKKLLTLSITIYYMKLQHFFHYLQKTSFQCHCYSSHQKCHSWTKTQKYILISFFRYNST